MHYSLVLVGAHNGAKTLPLIKESALLGRVLLVEPVPFLCEALRAAVKDIPNVSVANVCVALEDGMVEFSAPTARANEVLPGADQLGSMNSSHAAAHSQQLAGCFEVLAVESRTFASLLRDYDVTSVDTLFTDTEGYDCELLPDFPFDRVRPRVIVFEFKHSDGPFRVGPKLAGLLLRLEALQYDVSVLDVENMVATRRDAK